MEKLARELTLFDLVFYGVGVIVGAGIYALIGPATAMAGNATWLAFLIGACIAMLTGLSFAELASTYPEDAAEFVYVKHAFKNETLAFLIGWNTLVVSVFAVAAVSRGFGQYMDSLVPSYGPAVWAALIIAAMTVVNIWGIHKCSNLNEILTTGMALGLFAIIAMGIPHLGSVNYLDTPNGITGVIGAAALIFFAYLGFDEIVNAAEEAKNARKLVPKAIIISVIIASLIYIGIALSTVSLVNWQDIGASSAPLRLVASNFIPQAGTFLAITALFATAGTILIALVAGSRMVYGLAKKRELPSFLAYVARGERTPVMAALAIGLCSMLMATAEGLKGLASITDVGAFLTFAFINCSAVILRFRPNIKREFTVPFSLGRFSVLSTIGLLSCIYMLSTFEPRLWVIEAAVLILGLLFHTWEKKGHHSIPFPS